MAPRLISLILLGFSLIIARVDSSRTIPGDSFVNQIVVNEQKLEHASTPGESPAQHQAEQMVLQGGATVAAAPAGVGLDDKKNFIAWGGVGGFSGIGGYAGLGGAFPLLGGVGGIGKFGGIGGAAGIGGVGGLVPLGGVSGLGGGVGGLGGGAGGLGGVGGIGGGTGGLGGGTGGLPGGAGGLGGAAGGVGGHAVTGGSLHPRP